MSADAESRLAAKELTPDASAAAVAAEMAALRNQNVVLTRELGVLRWQFAKLLEQQPPIRAGYIRARGVFRRKFPGAAEKIAQFKRVVRGRSRQQQNASDGTQSVREVNVGARLVVKTPILMIAQGPQLKEFLSAAPAGGVSVLTPGAGMVCNLPVPPASAPTLQPAQSGSLAAYLVAAPAQLRNASTIVVDRGDLISLSLLRGRLVKGQSLLLVGGGSETAPNVSELGAPAAQDGDFALYSSLPIAWLDPLDASGKPLPDVTRQIAWPKISVVMVSFNQADFLEEGLRSVLEQGYPNLEFIVVDGNSTDGSIAILERYRSRVSTMVVEPDKGQSDGLNKGFARTTGDILTWVNSDDLLEPGALFRAAQAFMAHQVDLVAGGCRQIGLARSQVIHNHHTMLPYGIPIPLPLGLLLEMDRFWLNAAFFYQPEVFFSRDVWKRSGARLRTDLNYVLDYDLWVRMAAAGANIVHIPDFLACSRTHDQQKTTIGMPYLPEVQRLLREYASGLLSKTPAC